MATIREVAKAANVSITTVSKILSNDPDFRASQETRERVLKTAEELHYQYTGKKSLWTPTMLRSPAPPRPL